MIPLPHPDDFFLKYAFKTKKKTTFRNQYEIIPQYNFVNSHSTRAFQKELENEELII